MEPVTLAAFAASAAVLAAIPGPAMAYIAAQGIARGRRAGVMAALGVHVGGWVHVGLTAAGLTAALRLVPEAYLALRLAGAAYLAFMGVCLLRDSLREPLAPGTRPGPRSGARAFLDSMIVQVLNPKVALFFLAFLPQFVDPAGPWPIEVQMLVLGALLIVIFLALDLVVALTSGALGVAVRARRWVERVAGVALLGLGARLALDRG
jgi:threonine/homoserine/homoserine lactone efflux protein